MADKGFGNLSECDLASMIDAFLGEGNEEFEQNALYEFRLMSYGQDYFEKARNRIIAIEQKNRSHIQPDGLITPEGKAELRILSQELRD
ncbi:MAG: hypothetical protein R3C51_04710 [Parvularculaceae bacterium]